MKLITLLLLLVFSMQLTAQQTMPANQNRQTDYLFKSKNQKKAAWVFLAGGGLLVTIGAAIGINNAGHNLINLFDNTEQRSSGGATVLVITGTGLMLGSIPLFIAASKNEKKGNELSFSIKSEKKLFNPQKEYSKSSFPALSFKLSL